MVEPLSFQPINTCDKEIPMIIPCTKTLSMVLFKRIALVMNIPQKYFFYFTEWKFLFTLKFLSFFILFDLLKFAVLHLSCRILLTAIEKWIKPEKTKKNFLSRFPIVFLHLSRIYVTYLYTALGNWSHLHYFRNLLTFFFRSKIQKWVLRKINSIVFRMNAKKTMIMDDVEFW